MQRGGALQIDRLWVVLAIIFFGGLFLLKIVTAAVFAAGTRGMATEEEIIHKGYAARVLEQKDVDKLARIGENLLKKQKYYYAGLNLKQASDLDANYRDAAYGWAYAVFQVNQGNLTSNVLSDIKLALARAEKVDPYFEPLLKLKSLVAQVEGDEALLKVVEERMAILGLKN